MGPKTRGVGHRSVAVGLEVADKGLEGADITPSRVNPIRVKP